MFEQLFDSVNYYEFPSFEVAIYSFLLAFVLSTIIGLTYKVTFQGGKFSNNFFQAIVLSSMVSAMVVMAVGNNLAVGFGIIGAVAIIRFRTLIRDPRNIIFIFASLSVGIATGAYGYAIAVSGTFIFCVVAVLLYFSPFGKEKFKEFEIVFSPTDDNGLHRFQEFIRSKEANLVVIRLRTMEEGNDRYTYDIRLKIDVDEHEIFRELKNIEGVAEIRFERKERSDQL
jgi:uncharacterized membrane protein YhiD involved in acid resistance